MLGCLMRIFKAFSLQVSRWVVPLAFLIFLATGANSYGWFCGNLGEKKFELLQEGIRKDADIERNFLALFSGDPDLQARAHGNLIDYAHRVPKFVSLIQGHLIEFTFERFLETWNHQQKIWREGLSPSKAGPSWSQLIDRYVSGRSLLYSAARAIESVEIRESQLVGHLIGDLQSFESAEARLIEFLPKNLRNSWKDFSTDRKRRALKEAQHQIVNFFFNSKVAPHLLIPSQIHESSKSIRYFSSDQAKELESFSSEVVMGLLNTPFQPPRAPFFSSPKSFASFSSEAFKEFGLVLDLETPAEAALGIFVPSHELVRRALLRLGVSAGYTPNTAFMKYRTDLFRVDYIPSNYFAENVSPEQSYVFFLSVRQVPSTPADFRFISRLIQIFPNLKKDLIHFLPSEDLWNFWLKEMIREIDFKNEEFDPFLLKEFLIQEVPESFIEGSRSPLFYDQALLQTFYRWSETVINYTPVRLHFPREGFFMELMALKLFQLSDYVIPGEALPEKIVFSLRRDFAEFRDADLQHRRLYLRMLNSLFDQGLNPPTQSNFRLAYRRALVKIRSLFLEQGQVYGSLTQSPEGLSLLQKFQGLQREVKIP